jgi:hypothetical protein
MKERSRTQEWEFSPMKSATEVRKVVKFKCKMCGKNSELVC